MSNVERVEVRKADHPNDEGYDWHLLGGAQTPVFLWEDRAVWPQQLAQLWPHSTDSLGFPDGPTKGLFASDFGLDL